MPSSVADPRLDVPRKMLSMRGEADRKALAEEMKRVIGHAIERAIELAGLTKQDVSERMGYGTNQAPLSRWISGVETPQFAKLFGVDELRRTLPIALAELAGSGVRVRTTIEIERTA